MKRQRLVGGIVALLIVGAVVVVRMRARGPHGAAPSTQGSSESHGVAGAPLQAMMEAPEGANDCETAYNAFHAFDDSAKQNGMPSPWSTFPDKTTFVERCMARPVEEQRCLTPKYTAKHHPECDPILEDLMKKQTLFKPSASPVASSSASK